MGRRSHQPSHHGSTDQRPTRHDPGIGAVPPKLGVILGKRLGHVLDSGRQVRWEDRRLEVLGGRGTRRAQPDGDGHDGHDTKKSDGGGMVHTDPGVLVRPLR